MSVSGHLSVHSAYTPPSGALVLAVLLIMVHLMVWMLRSYDRRMTRDRVLARVALAISATNEAAEIVGTAQGAVVELLSTKTPPVVHVDLSPRPTTVPSGGLALPLIGPEGRGHGFLVLTAAGRISSPVLVSLMLLATVVGHALARADEHGRLLQQAERDSLTGLANRYVLMRHLVDAVQQAALSQTNGLAVGLSLIYVDVDRFKDINDTWGHGAGDRVLTTFAGRITRCVREGDVAVRLGGDEFAIVVHGEDPNGDLGEQVATRIRESLADIVLLPEGAAVVTSASTGVQRWRAGMSVSDLIDGADHAMYRGKSPVRQLSG